MDSIIKDKKNQYRDTTFEGINKVVHSIQTLRLRPHLLTLLVKEHMDKCPCSVCVSLETNEHMVTVDLVWNDFFV